LSGFLSSVCPGPVPFLSRLCRDLKAQRSLTYRPSHRSAEGCRDAPSQIPGPNVWPTPAARNAGPRVGTAFPNRTAPSSVLARLSALKRVGTPLTILPEPLGSPLTAFPASGRRNPTRPALDDLWWPSLWLPDPCWIEEREGRDACPVQPAFLSALCSTPGPAGPLGASLWWDALRPDTSAPARRAAEGKGGAAWRRDRSRAQPRTGPASGRAWRARRGPTPCPQRAPWHPHRQEWQKLSTAEKFKFFLSSDSGPHKPLIFMMKIGSNQRKRAGRSEETGG
jgi:hypothetical protein